LKMNHFLRVVAEALGCKPDSTGDFTKNNLWIHASERELLGWERCRVDTSALMAAFTEYNSKGEWQTTYLDWVFLDAMMYAVIYELIDNIHDDVLKPGDAGNWLPHVQRAFAKASDTEKAHPLWLDIKLTVMLTFLRWLPTLILLALGVGCFYAGWLPYWFHHGRDPSDIGEGWPTVGWIILGFLAARRIYRSVRWLARFGLRRRAWKMINMLTDGYALLGARAVPMRELRQAVEKAKDVFGRSAMFGVLDEVCARHPVSLDPSPGLS
jgi:hypothetical protein